VEVVVMAKEVLLLMLVDQEAALVVLLALVQREHKALRVKVMLVENICVLMVQVLIMVVVEEVLALLDQMHLTERLQVTVDQGLHLQ
jgi:small neutral amino acid transporter SnatA (MarC family)